MAAKTVRACCQRPRPFPAAVSRSKCLLHSLPYLWVMAVAQLAVKQEMAVSVDPAPTTAISDPADPLGLEERILTLCRQNEKGITDDVIVRDQPAIGAEKRMRALQRLLSQVWAGLRLLLVFINRGS